MTTGWSCPEPSGQAASLSPDGCPADQGHWWFIKDQEFWVIDQGLRTPMRCHAFGVFADGTVGHPFQPNHLQEFIGPAFANVGLQANLP